MIVHFFRNTLILFFCLILHRSYAQNDTLVFVNDDSMVGEVKSLDRKVVKVKTKYSDSNFQIEWPKVVYISTQQEFLVGLSNKSTFYGKLNSVDSSYLKIMAYDSSSFVTKLSNIVYLSPVEKKFIDRFDAQIDIGLSLTKANNLQQLTTYSMLAYRGKKWASSFTFNTLQSRQNEVEPISRTDGEINARYELYGSWYPIATFSMLSNTEQKLDLRMNAQLGMGKYIIRTNSSYWGAKLGANRNVERYSNETPGRDSWEAHFGTDLNFYDLRDFNMLSSVVVYGGITERGRWRCDANLDIKYDLPFDFYIKLGGSVNYDNQPAADASDLDYRLNTGFGWEW